MQKDITNKIKFELIKRHSRTHRGIRRVILISSDGVNERANILGTVERANEFYHSHLNNRYYPHASDGHEIGRKWEFNTLSEAADFLKQHYMELCFNSTLKNAFQKIS